MRNKPAPVHDIQWARSIAMKLRYGERIDAATLASAERILKVHAADATATQRDRAKRAEYHRRVKRALTAAKRRAPPASHVDPIQRSMR